MTLAACALVGFTLGWVARAAVPFFSRSYRQRALRAWLQREICMEWIVKLYEIKWDDAESKYDASSMPQSLFISVRAKDAQEALEQALIDASDMFGAIDGYGRAEIHGPYGRPN